jgi:hypothetical protein
MPANKYQTTKRHISNKKLSAGSGNRTAWRVGRFSVFGRSYSIAMFVFVLLFAGLVTVTLPRTLAASLNSTYSLSFACGGDNGHIQVLSFPQQGHLWGIIWTNNSSGCRGGGMYLYLSYQYFDPVLPHWVFDNIQIAHAGPGQSVGYNWIQYLSSLDAQVSGVKVTLCSSIGSWHCGPYKTF